MAVNVSKGLTYRPRLVNPPPVLPEAVARPLLDYLFGKTTWEDVETKTSGRITRLLAKGGAKTYTSDPMVVVG